MATQLDPTLFGYQNFYSALLTADITSGTLTISLDTVPSPSAGILIIDPDSSTSREIILYTSKGASTITCPSDGRGWGGSTAAAHLTGTTVIMAPIKEFFAGLADGTLSTDPLRSLFGNYVTSGGVVAQSAGLIGTFSNIVFYLNGQRYSGSSIANKTYTASKDTYVDVTAVSGGAVSVTYTEVANGASAPALTANYVRIAKVVTNGSAITSVTQDGSNDLLGNMIYPRFGQKFATAYKAYDTTGFTRALNSYATFTPATLPTGDRVITTRTGRIKVTLAVYCTVSSGNAELGVLINGTDYEMGTFSGATNVVRTLSRVISVTPGTYTVEFRFKSSGGGTITVGAFNDHVMALEEV